MNKELLMVVCVFAGLALSFIGVGNLSSSDIDTNRLTLTAEGCVYAKSVGLSTERKDDLCVADVRFRPNRLGSGGVIIMNDDRRLTVSDSMLLASERSSTDLPPTPELTAKANWGLAWLAVGGLLCVFGLFVGNSKSHSGRKKVGRE